MPGLGDVFNVNSQFGQLFLWSVFSELLNNALGPSFNDIDKFVKSKYVNEILSPEQLADLVERGHMPQSQAADEAAQSGINAARFDLLVRNNGNPPGPGELAEALRRGFIQPDSGNDTTPGYIQGIRQSRLQTQWADIIRRLDERLPGPETAVDAEVRGMRDSDAARELFRLYGGAVEQYQLLYDLAGEGPTPAELGVLANRGIISWDRQQLNDTSFQQGVAESRYKNKWEAAYRALAEYRPPPRTVTAMFREGSISEDQARAMLAHYGVTPEAMPAYLTKAVKSARQVAHELTESEIVHLYTERALTPEETKQHLTDLGYTATDADLIVAASDLAYHAKISAATITIIRNQYVHLHIDANTAIQRLDSVGVNAQYRDALIALWDMEMAAGTKSLTVKQIMDMNAMGILTADQALTKLRQAGYSEEDAGLLFALSNPDQAAQAAGLGINNNPGS